MPFITLKFKDKKIHDYPIATGQSYTIGRKATNDIVIDNIAVSSVHAKIESTAKTFTIRDLDSTNGTFVNKEQISRYNLIHNDTIFIGKHELIFDGSDLAKRSAPSNDIPEDEKTRILETRDHLKMTGRHGASSASESIDLYEEEEKKGSFLSRFFKKIFG